LIQKEAKKYFDSTYLFNGLNECFAIQGKRDAPPLCHPSPAHVQLRAFFAGTLRDALSQPVYY